MKGTISRVLIALVSLIILGTLAVGVYSALSGKHILRNATGRHQGWNRVAVNAEQLQQGPAAVSIAPTDEFGDVGRDNIRVRGRQASSRSPMNVEDLIEYEGTVVELGTDLVIETDAAQLLQIGIGPSSYFESLNFELREGDRVSAQGYLDGETLKAVSLTNQSTGQSVTLRDSTGRPDWAGQGWRRDA